MASKQVVYIVFESEDYEGGDVKRVFRDLEKARLYVTNDLSRRISRKPWTKSNEKSDVWVNGSNSVEIQEHYVMEGWEQEISFE